MRRPQNGIARRLKESSADMNEKLKRLHEILGELESVLVAYSGGTDSALLLMMARDVLHPRVLAVTSPHHGP